MKIKTTPSVVIRIFLWAAMLIGGTIGGIYMDLHYFRKLFFNPWLHIITFAIGFIMMRYAFRAAAVGGKELAKYGKKGDIPRLETNKLVTSGIYTYMRHPMLFGLTIVPLAWALMVGSISFIIFIAPIEMLFIMIMVLIFEEKECRQKFGKDYDEYAKKVPSVCFKRGCLKKLFSKQA